MANPSKVYIVDDDNRSAMRIKSILESQNQFNPEIINSNSEWEAKLDNGFEPDAVLCIDETLTGWPMPDGIQLGAIFKEKYKYNPLIIYSAYTSNTKRAYKAGVQHYLPRDVLTEQDAFSQILANCVARAAETIQLNTLQQLIDQLPLEFMLVDSNYRIVMINKKKEKIRGKDLIGKVCYKIFHGNEAKCTPCPVQRVMNYTEPFAQMDYWFPDKIWYEKAKAFIDNRFLSITAYPIETPRGRYIAEIVDDQTDAEVIKDLTRFLADAKEYDKIAEYTLDAIKQLGYTKGRIYIFNTNETDIEYAQHTPNLKTNLTIQDLKTIGRQAIKLWKEKNIQIKTGRWPFEHFGKIDGIEKIEIQERSFVIYSLFIQNHNSPEKKILGALIGNRECIDWEITGEDKKTIETISLLLSNKIESIKATKLKEEETRQNANYFQTLRKLLKKLQKISTTQAVIMTMLNYANQIIKGSNIYFYTYDEFKKEFMCKEKIINSQMDCDNAIIAKLLEKSFGNQVVTTDKRSYDKQTIRDQKSSLRYLPSENPVLPDYSFIAVPFTVKVKRSTEKYGILLAYKSYELFYTEIEIEMIHTIVNVCAIDYYNALTEFKMKEVVNQWKSLGLLHKYLHQCKSRDDLIKRCLTFITAGEGLGYNRALFFEYNNDKKHYSFKQAIGTIEEAQFLEIRNKIKDMHWDFETLLKRAPEIEDKIINNKMKDCIIDSGSETLWNCLHRDEPVVIDLFLQREKSESPEIDELKTRADLIYYIITRIPGEVTPLGCLIVDRRFAMQTFLLKDLQIVKTFASEMQRLFEIFEYKERMIETQYASTLGWMATALGHELNNPALVLHTNAELLIDYLEKGQLEKAKAKAGEIIQIKKRISETIDAIKGFIDVNKREKINPTSIIEQSRLLFEQKLKSHQIKCEININPDLPEIEVHSTSLKYAFTNLVKNAFDEFEKKGEKLSDPLIEIDCYNEDGSIIFQVKDNAGGIPPDVLEKIRKTGSIYSTKPSKGWGYGLNLVRQVALQHNGGFSIENRNDVKGAIARISIPIK